MDRIQKLGSVARTVFPKTHTLQEGAGETIYDMGFVLGLLLWALGLLWLFLASGSILQRLRFPFNLGWWAFTFPLGVYTTCTCQLGQEMPSQFFNVLGTVCWVLEQSELLTEFYRYFRSLLFCFGYWSCCSQSRVFTIEPCLWRRVSPTRRRNRRAKKWLGY